MTRMKEKYLNEVAPALMEKFQYKSVMQIPKIDKIVVSVGCGDCKDNAKALDAVIKDISAITGQHAVATTAKKSVANFKLREGMKVGVKVTLRQDRMWEFLDRLLNVALPRVRDFRGISADAFDGRGNYSLGLKEQIIFPEIEYDKIEKLRGMNIAITTTAQTDEEARELLRLMGAPAAARGQVLDPQVQPLQDLRPSARLPAQLRHLPYLLPRAGLQGPDPRSPQGKFLIYVLSGGS